MILSTPSKNAHLLWSVLSAVMLPNVHTQFLACDKSAKIRNRLWILISRVAMNLMFVAQAAIMATHTKRRKMITESYKITEVQDPGLLSMLNNPS